MKIKLLILLIAPLLLMNCKEDDEAASYIGVWIGTTLEASGCNEEQDDFSNALTCDANSCYKLTLNADGTFSYQQGLPTFAGTWSISGSTLSFFIDEEGEVEKTTYTTTLGAALTLSLFTESTGCTTITTFEKEVAA